MSANRLSHAERVLAGRKGAQQSWGETTDRTARTEKARAAADARFERQADPDGVLPAEERKKRAKALRAAFYADMQLRSMRSQRARRGTAQP